ncbi:putative transmembrane protein [Gregarina niphandrodes]|uniref:Transmembrane protein n=1 Tax=Gregarina niphandrodes TaxID=110365 RepID=A0A023AZ17_GRENI|nr:putative transmembrane protein [Gregarina niphandrodes]EZG43866.1 putative transmembrane protein [Gregarina niphandrodes]|eukprot:XP_011132954.1 putative transmembrane protein [Gregarina niphandrodes]
MEPGKVDRPAQRLVTEEPRPQEQADRRFAYGLWASVMALGCLNVAGAFTQLKGAVYSCLCGAATASCVIAGCEYARHHHSSDYCHVHAHLEQGPQIVQNMTDCPYGPRVVRTPHVHYENRPVMKQTIVRDPPRQEIYQPPPQVVTIPGEERTVMRQSFEKVPVTYWSKQAHGGQGKALDLTGGLPTLPDQRVVQKGPNGEVKAIITRASKSKGLGAAAGKAAAQTTAAADGTRVQGTTDLHDTAKTPISSSAKAPTALSAQVPNRQKKERYSKTAALLQSLQGNPSPSTSTPGSNSAAGSRVSLIQKAFSKLPEPQHWNSITWYPRRSPQSQKRVIIDRGDYHGIEILPRFTYQP